jgi:hypothetical protein
MKNLTWTKEGNFDLLKNNDETLITLSVKPCGASTFIIAGVSYQVVKKGFWKPVCCVVANNQEILTLETGFWTTNGTVTFRDGTVFRNDYRSNGKLAVRFFTEQAEILAYSYTLNGGTPKITFSIGNAILDVEKLLILAALGFVMFSTFFREMSASSDVIILV